MPVPSPDALFDRWDQAVYGVALEKKAVERLAVDDDALCSHPCLSSGKLDYTQLAAPLTAGWVESVTLEGHCEDGRTPAIVYVFYPAPGAATEPHVLPGAHALPSGAVEGAYVVEDFMHGGPARTESDGATFLLEGGVLVVAIGPAVSSARAYISRTATPPVRPPIAAGVDSWQLDVSAARVRAAAVGTRLEGFISEESFRVEWKTTAGATLAWYHYPDAAAADRAMPDPEYERTVEQRLGTRRWRNGLDYFESTR
jgi:hypothetical protein